AQKTQWILGQKSRNVARIVRVQRSDHRLSLTHALQALLAEAHRTGMEHEHVGRKHAAPAERLRTHAKIAFFAIAAAEVRFVEQARHSEAITAQIQTETDSRRQVGALSRRSVRNEAIERIETERAGNAPSPALEGIGTDRAVVGKR